MKSDYKCVLILPFFGPFKSYFNIFLRTCSYNSKINFLIFTDNEYQNYHYENVKFVKISFQEFVNKFKSKIGDFISLDNPYKLCDYKPTYGYVLEEYLKGYDYWGYCDCDVLFGDLYNLLLPLFQKNYDKVFAVGHLTLFKNTVENNKIFMNEFDGSPLYKDLLGRPEICWFDEAYKDDKKNIHFMFKQVGKNVYEDDMSLNPIGGKIKFQFQKYIPNKDKYELQSNEVSVVLWEDGKLFKIVKKKNEIIKTEELYIHLQHRKMRFDNNCISSKQILVKPNKFVACDGINIDKKYFIFHRQYTIYSLYDYFKSLLTRIVNKILKKKNTNLNWRK